MAQSNMEVLRTRLTKIAHLNTLLTLAGWDQEVNLPKKAVDSRAEAIAELSGLVYSEFIALDKDGLLSKLKKELDTKKVKGKDAVVVHHVWKQFERKKKLSESFVREMSQTISKSQNMWAEARAKNDFSIFLPYLTKIVALKKKEASLVGYTESPYDALLDEYEPGVTGKEAEAILGELKAFLIPFLKEVRKSQPKINRKKVLGKFPVHEQEKFNAFLVEKIGFEFERGHIATSTHPFTSTPHPHDVRITTRYKESDVLYALGSTIHEAGHGMYEQGLPAEHFGTPLADSISLGIHESQSRMWENIIGKSKEFWKFFYPQLQKRFPVPYKSISLDEFCAIINEVQPTYIRTESDEVTYNLHIIMRFELEKAMIEGKLKLADLPKAWNAKFKEYFGVEVTSDAVGVLQDVHWSAGYIGYFPTYSFGNLYSAQFYAQMEKEIPDIKKKIAKGEFAPLREWLRKHIHATGKTHSASDLVRKVTGEKLSSKYFTEYLKKKYSK